MCTVSMVIDQWQQPASPNYIPWPTVQHDPALALQMLEVIKRLEALDKRLGLLEQCKIATKDKAKLKRKLKRISAKSSENP